MKFQGTLSMLAASLATLVPSLVTGQPTRSAADASLNQADQNWKPGHISPAIGLARRDGRRCLSEIPGLCGLETLPYKISGGLRGGLSLNAAGGSAWPRNGQEKWWAGRWGEDFGLDGGNFQPKGLNRGRGGPPVLS